MISHVSFQLWQTFTAFPLNYVLNRPLHGHIVTKTCDTSHHVAHRSAGDTCTLLLMNRWTDHTHTPTCCLSLFGGMPTSIQLTCFNTCVVAMVAAALASQPLPVCSFLPFFVYLSASSLSLLSSSLLSLTTCSPISSLASDLSIVFPEPSSSSSSPPSNYLNTHPFSFPPSLSLPSLYLPLSCCSVSLAVYDTISLKMYEWECFGVCVAISISNGMEKELG